MPTETDSSIAEFVDPLFEETKSEECRPQVAIFERDAIGTKLMAAWMILPKDIEDLPESFDDIEMESIEELIEKDNAMGDDEDEEL